MPNRGSHVQASRIFVDCYTLHRRPADRERNRQRNRVPLPTARYHERGGDPVLAWCQPLEDPVSIAGRLPRRCYADLHLHYVALCIEGHDAECRGRPGCDGNGGRPRLQTHDSSSRVLGVGRSSNN